MSKDSITLSPEHGVNAAVVKCSYCDEAYGVALLGNARQYLCDCGQTILGTRSDACPNCKSAARSWKDQGPVDGSATTIRQGVCTRCQEELNAGAILFDCRCGSTGMIRHEAQLCGEIRAKLGVPAPNPCGVSLQTCPHCEVA